MQFSRIRLSDHLHLEACERSLGLKIQSPLEVSNLVGCFKPHGNHPLLSSLRDLMKAGRLPSAGITRPHRYYDPLRRPVPAGILSDAVGGATSARLGLPQLPRPLSRHAVLTTPADRTGALVGCFPARAAFPVSQAGRPPRLHFRGLLKLHSRYGLPVCLPTIRGLCYEASIRPVAQSNRSLATKSYRQLLGWDFHPPVICAVGAH